MKIIRIHELELRAIAELRAESGREGFHFLDRLCDDWASGANRFDAPGEALFLAVIGSQIAGICGLNRDPHAGDPRIGRVRRLYTLPSHRRHGVGTALINAVITHARGNFQQLRARTEEAGHFYVARGFRATNQVPEATHVFDLPD